MCHKILYLMGFLLVVNLFMCFGQQDSVPYPFYAGSFNGKIFTNFHMGITQADRSSAFEVRRAFFGYKTMLDKHISAEIKMDIGSPSDISEYSRIHRYAYFRTAAVTYKTEKAYFSFGIIDIDLFALQEDSWDHRYVAKSFMDEYRFGDRADLGAGFHYKVTKWVSADLTFMNGEGYANLQNDNAYKTGLGLSVYPVRNLLIRFYADYIEKAEKQMTLASFISLKVKPVVVSLEYNYKLNNDFALHHNQTGISAYLSYPLNEKFELFGRYDMLSSNILQEEDRPWNLHDDGSALITGIQYKVVKGLKASLNYQDWVPYAENMDRKAFLFLNFEIIL